jgi:hypothetical protein
LKTLGLLDQPSAPMLLVNGLKDSQIPIADLFLLLQHGDAKDAWVQSYRRTHGPLAIVAEPTNFRRDLDALDATASDAGDRGTAHPLEPWPPYVTASCRRSPAGA